jgi:hypothetical protein
MSGLLNLIGATANPPKDEPQPAQPEQAIRREAIAFPAQA